MSQSKASSSSNHTQQSATQNRKTNIHSLNSTYQTSKTMAGPGKLLKERTNNYWKPPMGTLLSNKQSKVTMAQQYQSPKPLPLSEQKARASEAFEAFWGQTPEIKNPFLSERKTLKVAETSPILSEGFQDIQSKLKEVTVNLREEVKLQQQSSQRSFRFQVPEKGEKSINIMNIDMSTTVKDLSFEVYNKIRNYVKSKTRDSRGQSTEPKSPISGFQLRDQKSQMLQHTELPVITLHVDDLQSESNKGGGSSQKNEVVASTSSQNSMERENCSIPLTGRQSILETMKTKIQSIIQFPGLFQLSPRTVVSGGRTSREKSADAGFSDVVKSEALTQRKSVDNTGPSFSQTLKKLENGNNRNELGFLQYYELQNNQGSKTVKNSAVQKRRKQSNTETFMNLTQPLTGINGTRDHINEILEAYQDLLTPYEKTEIIKYSEVYFLGTPEAKQQRKYKTNILLQKDLNSGFDRQGGFYKVVVGDHLAYRYEVLQELDRGAFGQVVRCLDHKLNRVVAVKINKNMHQHHNVCRAESSIMQRMRDMVPDEEPLTTQLRVQKERIVKYYEHFLFRNHYCFVFELLGKNLFNEMREHKFKSFDIRNKLRPLIYQIVQGLNYLKHCQVIHCDLKPENLIFTDEKRTELKIIDFGSASSEGMNTFTYVQSRFYRAPEVVLGLPYDCQVDMWSLGCIVAELFCGRPLFPGLDEHELLEFHVLMCGNPPQSLIDKCKKKDLFFDAQHRIIRSKQSRLKTLFKNSASLLHVLFTERFPENLKNQEILAQLSEDERLMVDFIRRCLQLDPKQRMTCEEAILHEWFKDLLRATDKQIGERLQEHECQQRLERMIKENRENRVEWFIKKEFEVDESPKFESENVFLRSNEAQEGESKFSHINHGEPGYKKNNFHKEESLRIVKPALKQISSLTTQNSSGTASKNVY